MIDIGQPDYESDFSLSLNGFASNEIQNHARLDIIYILSGSVHVETVHRQFDLQTDEFCAFNMLELYRLDFSEEAYVLRYSIAGTFIGRQKPNIDCISTDLRFGDEIFDKIRYQLAVIFQLYYKDADHNQALIYSHIYSLLDLLYKCFSSAEEAEKAVSNRFETLEKILNYIHSDYGQVIRLDTLAAKFYLSAGYISRLFQQYVGMTFSNYLKTVRLSNAYSQLRSTDKSITAIALDTGFGSTTQMIEAFKQRYGESPGKMRKRAPREKTPDAQLDVHIFDKLLSHAVQQQMPVVAAKAVERVHYRIEQPLEGRRFKPGFFKLINVGFAKEVLYVPIQEQLRLCQKMIGFEYIRFHGIYDEDMMVYRLDKSNKPVFNFNYLDMVFDFILSIGLKPYVEFGYFPLALASDLQKDFHKGSYIRGLPNSMERWCELVQETLRHWIKRYGLHQVLTWRFRTGEAHNSYYQCMSFHDYMYFYIETCHAVKQIEPGLQFGGLNLDIGQLRDDDPSENIDAYLGFLQKAKCLPDFYSFQCFYNEYSEHWSDTREAVQYHDSEPTTLSEDENYLANKISKLRRKIRAYDPRNRSVILDTWNSTIWQRDLRNDTCFKSAFLFKNMLENAENISAFGYWVMSDLMEEVYATRQLFHGGYGLLTSNGIPKAAFNAFVLLRKLGDRFVQRGDGYYITCNSDGEIQIALYNYCHYDTLSRQHLFVEGNDLNRYEMFRKNMSREYNFELALPDGDYVIKRYGISRGSGCGSAYDTWLEMGSPEDMDVEEAEHLKNMSEPSFSKTVQRVHGELPLRVSLEPHEVCILTIRRIE